MKRQSVKDSPTETKRFFSGPVEADEGDIGALKKNRGKHKRTARRGSRRAPLRGRGERLYMAATNGVTSSWAMVRRGYHGTYHKYSLKQLQHYIGEFAGRHSLRELESIDQMHHVVAGMVGRRLLYRDLVAAD